MHEQHEPAASSRARHPEPVRAYAAMNTVRALECLAFGALSTAELAAKLQVGVRTARRLLQRLELEGFVTQEKRGPWRRYNATLRLAALGRQLLEHAPVAQAATRCIAKLAQDTSCVAHLWIAGYDKQVVCAVHADGASCPTGLSHVASAPSSAAGRVLLRDRARLRSSCYVRLATEPTFAASVLERGQVVAALGVTGERALEASSAVVAAAGRLSVDLGSRP